MTEGIVIMTTQNLVAKTQRIAKIKIKSSTETLNKLLL